MAHTLYTVHTTRITFIIPPYTQSNSRLIVPFIALSIRTIGSIFSGFDPLFGPILASGGLVVGVAHHGTACGSYWSRFMLRDHLAHHTNFRRVWPSQTGEVASKRFPRCPGSPSFSPRCCSHSNTLVGIKADSGWFVDLPRSLAVGETVNLLS